MNCWKVKFNSFFWHLSHWKPIELLGDIRSFCCEKKCQFWNGGHWSPHWSLLFTFLFDTVLHCQNDYSIVYLFCKTWALAEWEFHCHVLLLLGRANWLQILMQRYVENPLVSKWWTVLPRVSDGNNRNLASMFFQSLCFWSLLSNFNQRVKIAKRNSLPSRFYPGSVWRHSQST